MRGAEGNAVAGGGTRGRVVSWVGLLALAGHAESRAIAAPPCRAQSTFFPHALRRDRPAPGLTDEVMKQVEGRSLKPLLLDPKAQWDERTLFTHVVALAPRARMWTTFKFADCSVRTPAAGTW